MRISAGHPMVVNPCTGLLYDPLKSDRLGQRTGSGEIVKGGGLRPPFR